MLPTFHQAVRPYIAALLIGTAVPVAAAHDMTSAPVPSAMTEGQHGDGANSFPEEAPFLVENQAAMDRMMTDMAVKPTGDVDRDFVAMMAPHHQGAIDMAKAVLRYGKNEQLRRLAQEIIVTQQQEIAAMRMAVGEPLPPSVAAPTQLFADTPAPGQVMHHQSMK